MGNSAKNKGDRFEREAVTALVELLPEFAVENPMRMLGAGRKDDIGDLSVLPDTAVQVRAKKDMGQAIRSSAEDSVKQAANGRVPYALGMVPILGTRANQVRWLACTALDAWPGGMDPVAEFAIVSKALAWVRDDAGPHGYRPWQRLERVGLLRGPGYPALIAPLEAWTDAYRRMSEADTLLAA
ncbi:hypothetical protein [Arthrobacter caoxuetaonis]|uniref:Uncharacterized protein n=1 Tax=Arthrobacter caoxuetaonis TaxID=2886935 RepID=A0A9X1SE29_9MICC|nr:hypothetical protein [Arthrobacter caoxuetaonis]MCC3299487.1 hypothetical protein [Arthrobacter caoxuetaonis]USQ59021.1 hypothetical protein NF551_18115 [Arthrobacter caoxuetaonis]